MLKKLTPSDIRSGTVTIACTIIYGILNGTPLLSSLLFVETMTRFGVDRQQASYPYFLCYTIKNAFGPLIGYLGGRFGQKNMLMFGCLFTSIAVGGCFLAEDIVTIAVLWGALYGFGYGLGIAFIPEILSMHFSNHLGKAIGFYVAGECIASFLLILLTEYLLKTYGLSGTFLLLSGILMQTIPAAMLIKKPYNKNQNLGEKDVLSQESVIKYDLEDEKLNFAISENLEQKTRHHKGVEKTAPTILNSPEQKLATALLDRTPRNSEKNQMLVHDHIMKNNTDSENEKFVIFSNLEQKMDQQKLVGNDVLTILKSPKKKLDPKPSIYVFRVFLNPTYILILLIEGIMLYIFTLSSTILVDISRDHGVSLDDAVYILVIHQAANAIGRFALGFVTDRGYLSKANFLVLWFAALGLSFVAFIWIRGFTGMVIFVLLLGVFIGGLHVLSPIIVMEYVDKDCFSVALPSRFLLYMPMGFTQAPLLGFFRDKLQSYNGIIYIVIAMCCINIILSLMVPVTERYRLKRKGCLQDKQGTS